MPSAPPRPGRAACPLAAASPGPSFVIREPKRRRDENGEIKYKGRESAIDAALKAKPEFDKQKSEFAKMQAEGNYKGIFDAMGIPYTELSDGTISLNDYEPFLKNTYTSGFDLCHHR